LTTKVHLAAERRSGQFTGRHDVVVAGHADHQLATGPLAPRRSAVAAEW
jgi:hypothetical protein